MKSEARFAAVVVIVFTAFFAWLMHDFWRNSTDCEAAGGEYLRGLLVWKCVDGTSIPYGEDNE